jgi:hypothetical protein
MARLETVRKIPDSITLFIDELHKLLISTPVYSKN